MVPGRGLRNARLPDLPRQAGDAPGTWSVAARLHHGNADTDLGTGTSPDGHGDRRVFRLNGVAPRSQAEVAAVMAAVWLTPQMDRLFQEGASGRRRFLDRLTWALEPGHAREVSAYETAMASRNRLLHTGADPAWLAGTEDSMARHAVAATAARSGLVAQLNAMPAPGRFPAARLALLDPIADRLAQAPALDVEDWLRAELAANRPRDAASGSAQLGAHRADMALSDADSGLPATLASTGQQKALLIGVVLGHAALIAQARGSSPMLLLDEPAVHLDGNRRAALWDALQGLQAQVLLTGTDPEPFEALRGVAEGLRTGDGALRADPAFGG